MATEPTTDHEAVATSDPARGASPRPPGRAGGTVAIVVAIADVVVPIALYYVCRGLGFSELGSLLISSVAPVVSFVVQALVTRRADGIAIFIGAVLLLNIAVALTAAD